MWLGLDGMQEQRMHKKRLAQVCKAGSPAITAMRASHLGALPPLGVLGRRLCLGRRCAGHQVALPRIDADAAAGIVRVMRKAEGCPARARA